MALERRAHVLGPETCTLTVHTGKTGAAAKAGHNLRIEVTSWKGTLELGDSPSVTLTADTRSLRVREGAGGMQSLGGDDKANIDKTIDDEVLKGTTVAFRSSSVEIDGPNVRVEGELELAGQRRPLAFELTLDDEKLTGRAVVKQTDWGMKPYSTLFGTLKVADEIEVVVDGTLAG